MAALSKVDICNAAVYKLGQDIRIASLSENTKTARIFAGIYDRVRDFVLADSQPPWAMKSVALAQSNLGAYPGWGYRYDYPADCLTAYAMSDGGGIRTSTRFASSPVGDPTWGWDARQSFDVVYGDQATSIVSDFPIAYLTYFASIDDPGRYPPQFVEAFACRLAWEAAPAIAGEVGLRLKPALMQDYQMARLTAAAHSGNESLELFEPTTPSLAARQ